MTEKNQYCFTSEEFIEQMNKIKDYILEELKQDNIISEETQKNLSKTYFLTIVRPSWISKFFKKETSSSITNIIVSKIRKNSYQEKELLIDN